MPKFLSDVEKAYLAGIIDGEGCFNIHKNSNRVSFTARLMVSMTDGRAVAMLHAAYGGSLRLNKTKTPRHKDQWYWYATGVSLERAAADLLKYIVVKREAALICLELRESMKAHAHLVKGKKGIQQIPPDLFAYRLTLKHKLNELNRSGKAVERCLAS